VDEEEMKKALPWLWRKGFYVEPTAAATAAGIFKYMEDSDPEEILVSVLTGHGLKATEKILQILEEPLST
jgi:threonine synthase